MLPWAAAPRCSPRSPSPPLSSNLRLFVAVLIAVAGFLAPLLPVVEIAGEEYRGVDRVPLGILLAAPALFPLLSTTTRQWLPRRPGPRTLALVVEAGWFLAFAAAGYVQLFFTPLPLTLLPGFAAVVAVELLGLVVGGHFGWRRPSDVVRR